MSKKFIDISYANTVSDWNAVARNVDGVIIRIGYRGYSAGNIKPDAKFDKHIQGALSAGIPVGFYFMSQAVNETEAEQEADYCCDQLVNYSMMLPDCRDIQIYYDSEYSNNKKTGRADKLTKQQRTAVCRAFCRKIEEYCYRAGVYASKSWYESHLIASELTDYIMWVAQYNKVCTATCRVDMWQYTSNGNVSGVNGRVDISECYIDFENYYSESDVETSDKQKLYWITAGDLWTHEEAEKAKKSFEARYPGIPLGIRRANLEDVEVLG